MSPDYLSLPGESITLEELKIPKAIDVANALKSKALPFVELVGCHKLHLSDEEAVIFCVEVELGQKTVHDIRRYEQIAAVFSPSDVKAPEVLALRYGFPKVPHLYLREQETPRSLCLFEAAYEELKRGWTPVRFIERIREWLALTAKGRLHGDDQPLEPLLISFSGRIIIPFDLFTKEPTEIPELLKVHAVYGGNGSLTLIAGPEDIDLFQREKLSFVATAFQCNPQPHGVIHKRPQTLLEVHQFTEKAGLDLLEGLRKRLRNWQMNKPLKNMLEARLMLIISFPKSRGSIGTVETTDIWAFLCVDTIGKMGVEIGVWDYKDGVPGILLPADQTKIGDKLLLDLFQPVSSFSRNLANALNNLSERERKKITAIGVGALGSQVFMNLIRSGYGEWTLIDDDILLPHNLARHSLDGSAVGFSKAEYLAFVANKTIDGEPIAKGVIENVLNPKKLFEEVQKALKEADVILDFSASVAVARHLARGVDSDARRISAFLNPSGCDLILLAEDANRVTSLDYIEMQYYRCLIEEPEMEKHLNRNDGHVRYANSCRDISSLIPQDLIGLHASICGHAIRKAVRSEAAIISIWRANLSDMSVRRIVFTAEPMIEHRIGDWTVCTDQKLFKKVFNSRLIKLPYETGGVLVGLFDMQRKMVYVLDILPSPPDSKEWPTVYIRGCQGLRRQIDRIQRVTEGALEYVGEWHSHPRACDCKPSRDDHKAFSWLKNMMNEEGLPPLMLIAGDWNQYAFYIGQMS